MPFDGKGKVSITMANPKNVNVVAQLIAFALVFWKKDNNWRSKGNYGKPDEIRNSLAERGWVQHYAVSVCPITEEERKEALAERTERWAALKAATTPDAAVERQVFERLYVDPKTNKLHVPQYSGNAGFRRASVFESAMVQRFRDGSIPDSEKILDQIPVSIKEYGEEAERIIDQQLENELQNVGNLKMDDNDKIRITKKLYDLGKPQVYIRKLYTSTTGQKMFGICEANNKWPALKVYDRLFLEATDASQIPIKAIRHDAITKIVNRHDADLKRSKGLPLTDKERSYEPITEVEVSNYFRDLKAVGAVNLPKMMDRKNVEAGAKQNLVEFFRVAFSSVEDNAQGPMVPYMGHAEALNLHKKLIDAGKGDAALAALKLLDSGIQVGPVVPVKTVNNNGSPVVPAEPKQTAVAAV